MAWVKDGITLAETVSWSFLDSDKTSLKITSNMSVQLNCSGNVTSEELPSSNTITGELAVNFRELSESSDVLSVTPPDSGIVISEKTSLWP